MINMSILTDLFTKWGLGPVEQTLVGIVLGGLLVALIIYATKQYQRIRKLCKSTWAQLKEHRRARLEKRATARKIRQLREKAAERARQQPVEEIPWPDTFRHAPPEDAEWEAKWQHHVGLSDRTIESGFRCLADDIAVLLCGLAIKNDRQEIKGTTGWKIRAWREDGLTFTVFTRTELPTNERRESFNFTGYGSIPENIWTPVRNWLIADDRTEDELTEVCRTIWGELPLNNEMPVGRWNNDPKMQSTIMKWETRTDDVFYTVIHANNDVAHCWRGTTKGIPNEATDYLFVKLMRDIPHKSNDRRRRLPLKKGLSYQDGSPCNEERTGRKSIEE